MAKEVRSYSKSMDPVDGCTGTTPELLVCGAPSSRGVPPLEVYPRNDGIGRGSPGAPDEEVVGGTIKIAPAVAADPNAIFGTGAFTQVVLSPNVSVRALTWATFNEPKESMKNAL